MMRLCVLLLCLCSLLARTPAYAQTRIWEKAEPFGQEFNLEERGDWRFLSDREIAEGRVLPSDGVVQSANVLVAFCARSAAAHVFVPVDNRFVEKLRVCCLPGDRRDGKAVLAVGKSKGDAHPAVAFLLDGKPDGRRLEYSFDDGIVRVDPKGGVDGVEFAVDLAYAIVPDFLTDDLVYEPSRAEGLGELFLPAESVFVGLLQGEDSILTVCWPNPAEQLSVLPAKDGNGNPLFRSVRLKAGAGSICLGLTTAPGIWHAEPVGLSHLERDVAVNWRPPLPGRWTAQFGYKMYFPGNWTRPKPYAKYVGTATTYLVPTGQRRTWKATVGWHEWPCWFEKGKAYIRIGKKVQPVSREVLFYCLERGPDTPREAMLPVDVLSRALGEEAAGRMVDVEGRRVHSFHREDSVFRMPVCGTTAALTQVFEWGIENREREMVASVGDDIEYYFRRLQQRIGVFLELAAEVKAFKKEAGKRSPKLAAFLDDAGAAQAATRIETGNRMLKGMRLVESGSRLVEGIRRLSRTQSVENLPRYVDIIGKLVCIANMMDHSVAVSDLVARGLMQRAGYRCIDSPEKAKAARELRRLIRKYLRNPSVWEQTR